MNQENIEQIIPSLRKEGPVLLLESQMRDHPSSHKSYIAGRPRAWIKAYSDSVTIYEDDREATIEANPWKALSDFRSKYPGWLFGYFGYDLKNNIEVLSSGNTDYLEAPDLFFFVPGLLLEMDQEGSVRTILGDTDGIGKGGLPGPEMKLELVQKVSGNDYVKLIQRAKDDIREGEYYEVNISHPLIFDFQGDSWQLYRQMKKSGPVPFGAYLSLDEFSVCCSSPERFLAKEGNRVWSQPIKGTASRSGEFDYDAIEELRNSVKNRAENLMIVDLVRNDLSRIARNSTVRVEDLFEIQTFETVHQMVSTVACEVESNVDVVEIIKSCFPMGSMTGAPKIAAMKAIEELESYKRGIYSGAIGYFKPNDDFDFNVVIRTALVRGNKLVYPVGGAITSDSIPEEEWEETLVKAKALTGILNKKEVT